MPACRACSNCGTSSGHARADNDQVLFVESALAVISGLDHDAAVEQQRYLVRQFLFRLGVGDGNARASVRQKESAGDAGLAQSDDQYAFAFYIHGRFVRRVIVPRLARR